jgi:type IV secretion system protein VirD4
LPLSDAWGLIHEPEEKEQARQRETLRCDAENATLDLWAAKLAALNDTREKLQATARAKNWQAFRAALDDAKAPLVELSKAATENHDAQGAASVLSLFGQDLNYFFQNVGLPAPSSFEDSLAKISQATETTGQESKAATVAMSILNQAAERGQAFGVGLSRAAGDKVKAETLALRKATGDARLDRLKGRTSKGYWDGFPERIASVWKPWLIVLLIVGFGGFGLGKKQRLDPVAAAAAAVLAYALPGVVMAGAFVFLPFLPQWLILAATLAGTATTYVYAGPLFRRLATMVGNGTWAGRRLLTLGGALEQLRAGLAHPPTTSPVATHGSARWGSVGELRQANHLHEPQNAPQSAGMALARVPDAPQGFDPRLRHIGHVVTVAPNGSGKGIGAVIPNLLEYPGSCLVLDVKGENAAVTARARREMGHKVFLVDPFEANGSDGAAFNVMDRLDPASADCVSESALLADSLVIADNRGGENDHFSESAKTLLQGMSLHVAVLPDPSRRHLGELRRLLTADEETFLGTLAEMAADEQAAFGLPARAANTLMGMADRERGSVLSTARLNTAFLDDPRIAKALSRSDFDLSAIKAEPMTVYLVIPANKITANARFVRLFVGSVIAAVTASPKQPPHRVAFFLDEFAQLGYMKSIEDAVSLMRGYGLAFWVFLQDLSQLKGVYPRWQTFMANSAKMFFGTADYDTAKYVSDSLGQITIEYKTGNTGQNSGTGVSGQGGTMHKGSSAGSAQQFTGRPLLTPDEVMRLPPEKVIVMVKSESPYLLERLNYLTDEEYSGKADPNPYHG